MAAEKLTPEQCSIRPAEDWRWHLKCVEREIETLRTAGVIEVAVRNPSVAEYMRHWEERATKAEAEVVQLREQLNAELKWRRENSND